MAAIEKFYDKLLQTAVPIQNFPRNAAFAEESAEVEVLFAEAAKFDNISKKIKASLARLEGGAQVVKDSIGPVYSNTQSLQTMNENIDGILAAIDKMLVPSVDEDHEKIIIRAGPGKVGLPEYLTSLKRIDRALSKMLERNLRVNQQAIGDCNELMSEGIIQLQKLFRFDLASSFQLVEPLHYITKQLPFPAISEQLVTELSAIDKFIAQKDGPYNQRDSPSVRMYAEIRGPYLSGSLQNLSTASMTTSKKKAADEIYRQGTSGITTYANGIEEIFLAEYQNISAIFSRDAWGPAFELTCQKAMADFTKTIRELNNHIKSNLTTDCFLAYEMIEIITQVSFRLDSKTGELKNAFADALKPIRETAKLSIPELIEDIRRRFQSMTALPLDGSSIPYTTDVMNRLQTMTLYAKSLASILTSLGDGNWTSKSPNNFGASSTSLPSLKSFDVGADGNQLLSHYIIDTMETLLTSLDAKARAYIKTKALHGVFMANNVAVIDRAIRNSPDLSSILSSVGAPAKIDSWRKKGTSSYLDSWREPCSALLDVQYTNRGGRPPSGSNGVIDSAVVIKGLGSKDKDTIKEKFKTFNTSFDELCSRHKGMGMEREVRIQLAREVQAMIEPLYSRFWDRYHEIDKGKGKYVKYDKGSLSAQLATLA